MDPDACLQRWRDAETRAERRDAREDLCGWLARGGFEPKWKNARERSYFICRAPDRRSGLKKIRWGSSHV